MASDDDAVTTETSGSEEILPDVSALPATVVLASGDTVLLRALRRLAADGGNAEILAAFGNFAPSDPPPQ